MKKYILLTLVLTVGIVALYFIKPQLFMPIPKFKDDNSKRYTSPNVNISIILNSVSMNIPAKSQKILFSKTYDPKNSNDRCVSSSYENFWLNRDEKWKQYIGKNANGYIDILYNNIPKQLKQDVCNVYIDEEEFKKHSFLLSCPAFKLTTIPIIIEGMNNAAEYAQFIYQIKQYDIEIEEFGPSIEPYNSEDFKNCM